MPRESLTSKRSRALEVCRRLDLLFPEAECALNFGDPFSLVIAVLLSAQTTDASVNKVTPVLFGRWPTPADLAAAPLPEVEEVLHPLGFFRSKARHITACAQMVVSDFGGEVPRTMEELTRLPGVGRKTANIVGALRPPGLRRPQARLSLPRRHRRGRGNGQPGPRRNHGAQSLPPGRPLPQLRQAAPHQGRSTQKGLHQEEVLADVPAQRHHDGRRGRFSPSRPYPASPGRIARLYQLANTKNATPMATNSTAHRRSAAINSSGVFSPATRT